jgi:2-oxoglutarate dehydrogenase E2 component (dihydrolipoamide succinyltransferase)
MAIEVVIPTVGESVATVFIARWIAKEGDVLAAGQPVLEIDSDKASMEVPAPAAGVLTRQLFEAGAEVAIGAVVAELGEVGAVAAPAAAAASVVEAAEPGRAAQSGPAARQVAAQAGVALNEVPGSGTRGRILSQDVRAAAEQAERAPNGNPGVVPPAVASAAVSGGVSAPAPVASGALEEIVPMTPMRRTIARRLVEAQHTAAMLTTFNEVDCSAVMDLRKRYQDRFQERHGLKVGFMSFFVKAAVEALKEFPSVNAEIRGDHIVYKRYYNIGVAVSGPKGLVVPVLRDADRLSFAKVEQGIGDLAKKARDNKLSLDDFKEGTFTISNGGVFGSLMSTPILNPPQVGILGMHAINDRPVGVNGQIVLRPMMYVALSYDHRIIDGREAVSFLKRVKELVEAPERLLLEV